MERSYDLVKKEKLGVLDALSYGFYMLKKHMDSWKYPLIANVCFLVIMAIIGIIAFLGITASISSFYTLGNELVYNDANLDSTMYVMFGFIGLYLLVLVLIMVVSIIINAFQLFALERSYIKEWNINTPKKQKRHYVFKSIKYTLGILLLSMLIYIICMIPFCIIFGVLIAISIAVESNSLIVLTVFLFYIIMIFLSTILTFVYMSILYEYLINNNRFGDSVKQVLDIVKRNFLSILGFSILFLLLMWLIIFLTSIIGMFLSIIPLLGFVVMPFIQISSYVLFFYAVTIKYMNLKYKAGNKIFPDSFIENLNSEDNTVVKTTTEYVLNKTSLNNQENKVEELPLNSSEVLAIDNKVETTEENLIQINKIVEENIENIESNEENIESVESNIYEKAELNFDEDTDYTDVTKDIEQEEK
ncbi:MAG: hypothetical protein ACK5LY_09190 [Lachnospirales bacterium]